MTHLDDTALARLAHGATAETDRVDREHLAECPHCRQRLAALEARTAPDARTVQATFAEGPGHPPRRTSFPGEASARPLQRGDRIGRYLLLEPLGEGGMGVVYAAHDSELDRKIAVKLLSPAASQAVSAGDGQARLLREAQAMARISHPNVIAVHDVGTIGDQVFVAMEYVDGGTLGGWLRERPRTWREVLRVFIEAGRGLTAAHAAGLVHRDFKPENVLVGRDGRVRVTDFGLARMATLAPDDSTLMAAPVPPDEEQARRLETTLTEPGLVMGTPNYMAPEQMLGRPSDARSDQFSYCAALYWALYRQRPFDPSRLSAAARRNAARADEPTRPGEPPASRPTSYELPAGSPIREPPRDARVPAWVRRAVLRGLALDPADRFPSMEPLLEALGNNPWVTRRRWLAVGGAALALAAGVAIAARTPGARDQLCRGAERQLAGVWDDGIRTAIEKAFLATGKEYASATVTRIGALLDTYARGWVTMRTEACEATRIRGEQTEQVLSLRMACLDRRLEELQALTAILARADAAVVDKAVDAVHGLPHLRRCADVEALTAPVPLPEDPAARVKLDEVARKLATAKALYGAGRYRDGLKVAEETVAAARGLGYAPLTSDALEIAGALHERLGDHKAAEALLEEAVWTAEEGRYDEGKVRAATSLVYAVGYSAGRFEAGHAWARLAKAALKRLGGNDELEAELLGHLANVYFAQGRHDDAREPFERALALAEKAFGPEHPRVGNLLSNVAALHLREGDADEATASLERSIAIIGRTLGPRHPNAAYPHNLLGAVYRARGDTARAREHVETALSIWESALGPEHPIVADAVDALTTLLQEEGQYEQALALARRALAIKEKALGPDHVDLGYSLDNLGQALISLARPKEAIPPLERAIRLRQAAGLEPSELAESRFALARALWDAGQDRRRAVALAREARAGYEAAKDAEHARKVAEWLAGHAGP